MARAEPGEAFSAPHMNANIAVALELRSAELAMVRGICKLKIGVKMGVLGNPFKLLGRLLIVSFQITGYTVTLIIQIFGYLYYRKRYMIVDAFGSFGRSVTDAVVDVFRD